MRETEERAGIVGQVSVKKAVKKILQTSERYQRVKRDNYCGVVDRQFCEPAEFSKFIDKIDELLAAGHSLKAWSRSTYVAHLTWNDKDIVVKKYNYKGANHAVRQTIKNMNSRARRSWLYSHRLKMLDIPGPEPLAYIEKYAGPIVLTSYFISEKLHGQSLSAYLQDETVCPSEYPSVAQKVLNLLQRMGKYKIYHGDLNFRNILLTDNRAIIVDLDRLRVHRWNWSYRLWHLKDLKRFARDLHLHPAFKAVVYDSVKQRGTRAFACLFTAE